MRKTLLCGVQIVKEQLDPEGLHIIEDGKSTVCALLEIFEHYKAKRNSLAVEAAEEVVVSGYSHSLVDTFENGLTVDIVFYKDGYDRLTHMAFECNRALAKDVNSPPRLTGQKWP